MSPARRFPFGQEPAPSPVEKTMPVPPMHVPAPDPQATAPLGDFVPRSPVYPFRAPPEAGVQRSLVPPPPPREARRPRIPLRTVGWMVLLVADMVVLTYLAATWGR